MSVLSLSLITDAILMLGSLSYILKLIITFYIFFVPGFMIYNAFVKRRDITFLEMILLQLLMSLMISCWVGLLLAEIGYFSLSNLLILLVAFTGVLVCFYKEKYHLVDNILHIRPEMSNTSLILAVITFLAVLLFFQPMFTSFLADEVIIVSHSVNIAESGSILAKDPIMENMSHNSINAFYQPYNTILCNNLQFPGYGFYVENNYTIRFQYLDLYPIFLGIIYSIYGIKSFIYGSSFIAILCILFIFILTNKLFDNSGIALLSMLLLTINFAQIFFARYPGAELLYQLLILGGIYTVILMVKTDDIFYSILAAFLFSGCFLTRVDSVILYLPIIMLFCVLMLVDGPTKRYLYFAVPFLALNIHSWIHNIFFDAPYIADQYKVANLWIYINSYFNIIGNPYLGLLLVFVILSMAIGIFFTILINYRDRVINILTCLSARIKILKLINVIIFLSIFVFLYYIRPQLDPSITTGKTLLLVGQPITFVGLLLATYGLIIFVNNYILSDNFKKKNCAMIFFLIVGICYTTYYLIDLTNQPIFPWAFRRYITVVIPFLVILMSYGLMNLQELSQLMPKCLNKSELSRRIILKDILILIITIFLIGSVLFASLPIIKSDSTECFVLQIEKLAERFDENDVILLNGEKNVGMALKHIFNKNSIVLLNTIDMNLLISQIYDWQNESRNIYMINPDPVFLNDFGPFSLHYMYNSPIMDSPDNIYKVLHIYKLNTDTKGAKVSNTTEYKYLIAPNSPPLVTFIYGSINNTTKLVQFQHPTSMIEHNAYISPNAKLRFSIALDPEVWSSEKGDGVLFEVYIVKNEKEKKVFSRYIDPKNNFTERKWNDFEIDLSPYSNDNLTILFVTSGGPKNDTMYDWAWWGEPKLVSS